MTKSRICLHPKCRETIDATRIYCKPHWFQLPKPLRDAIWDAHRRRDRKASMRNIREACSYQLAMEKK